MFILHFEAVSSLWRLELETRASRGLLCDCEIFRIIRINLQITFVSSSRGGQHTSLDLSSIWPSETEFSKHKQNVFKVPAENQKPSRHQSQGVFETSPVLAQLLKLLYHTR